MPDRPVPAPLVRLPDQPAGVPWPTGEWPRGTAPAGLARLVDEAFSPGGGMGDTYAVIVVHAGRMVAERYGGALLNWEGPGEPVGPGTRLRSWSMAKSVLHAAVGIVSARGHIDVGGRAPVPEWEGTADPRRAITVEHLLEMRDGLDFVEDYVDDRVSDTIQMLFGTGRADVAGYAASRPPAAPPGSRFNYSSGTSNILARILGTAVGGADAVRRLLADDLFLRIGARSAEPEMDAAGTWVASSYVRATAQDFARFGYLYLRGGCWDGVPVLSPGWIDHGRTPRSVDPDDPTTLYGAHWWCSGDAAGTFWASGYEGQRIVLSPARDAMVVRLGRTTAGDYPVLRRWCDAVLGLFG